MFPVLPRFFTSRTRDSADSGARGLIKKRVDIRLIGDIVI